MSTLAEMLVGVTAHDHLGRYCVAPPVVLGTLGAHVAPAIRVAQYNRSSGSVDVVVVPDTVTNENGGCSSSKHNGDAPVAQDRLALDGVGRRS